MDHAVEAGKGRAIALVAVAVELLLCEDVSTALGRYCQLAMHSPGEGPIEGAGQRRGGRSSTSQEKETMAAGGVST